jgi:hypothetical protein
VGDQPPVVPANFHAANGWGTTATVDGLFMPWLLAIGISTVRSARTAMPPQVVRSPATVG